MLKCQTIYRPKAHKLPVSVVFIGLSNEIVNKFIVSNPEQAHLSLADMGCACALKDVLAISIPDKPGNLHRLLDVLAAGGINIVDAHGFVLQPNQKGICILEIENLAQTNAEQVVRKAGFDILDDDALNNL
jgi:hypothetical protein